MFSTYQKLNRATLLAAILIFGCATVQLAHADAIYTLDLDGCSGGCGPQTSFGTIDLMQVDSNTVQISLSLLNNNVNLTTGSHTGFSFNVQGGAITLGTLPTGWVDAGTNVTQPGFGTFTNGVDCSMGNSNNKSGCAGSNPWVGTLTFDVSRSTGLDLTDFVVNGSGNYFATDILSGTTGKTGLVASDQQAPTTPEPGTLALMGTGLIGSAFGLRKRLAAR
jgi:hypothetical protein